MHMIHDTKLDLNLLLAFDALIRERSVTRAAAQLGLTQSAMSHALRRLREYFNDPLFVKVGDAMKPTPKAEHLSATVLQVVALIRDDVVSQAAFDAAKAKRRFRLSMTDMGELVFLPKIIDHLRQSAPNCSVRTIQPPTEQVAWILESGEADLALGSLHSVPEGLYQQKLFLHPFVTIVSAQNTEIGDRISLEKFCQMQHIVVTLSGKTDPYDRVYEDNGIQRDIYLVTPHFLTVPHILEQNPNMVATVPFELGRVFQKNNVIRMIHPPIELPPIPIRQYWHPRYHHDEANVWLRKFIKSSFDDYEKFTPAYLSRLNTLGEEN
ncbi:LysR family transcriptional regulator [Aquisalimonas lutea]|uniref:LysR family transcriptional regulator n=1 Tax=Aquisalimonas lutea TaxID=1327750 RepID=UPI0025B4325C|nr:LysR family transcriptional regulator [Aquisalimonas lutea]MDN3518101.1 LysR family transcriptional regulator [Aquisalimonas lutea]